MIAPLFLCLSSACAPPQTTAFEAYLKASNTAVLNHFAYGVAVSGDTIVVGARDEGSAATGVNGPQQQGGALDSGAAYVFVRSGTTWTQQAYLKASNANAFDWFGASVAIDGDTIVVGALREGTSVGISGAAYVFVRSGTTWTEQAFLKASNPHTHSQFGFSTAISGDTIVIGARREDSGSPGINGDQSSTTASNSGALYVFVRNGTTWSQQAYIKASNPSSFDEFGRAVAIDGDIIVAGSDTEDSLGTGINGVPNDAGENAGAAYVFVRAGSTWTQEAFFKGHNTHAGDRFGGAVSVSGTTVVVGAWNEDSNDTGVNGDGTDNSNRGSGAAYVFVRNGSTWSQQAYLKASNTAAGDAFGNSVAVAGDRLVVGALWEDSGADCVNGSQGNHLGSAGAVYNFSRSASTWSQVAYLKSNGPGVNDEFGSNCALSGTTVVVGAMKEDSGSTGVNGDPLNDDVISAGAAYVFDLDAPSPPPTPGPDFCSGNGGDQAGCTNCPCGNNACGDVIGGCLNGSGTSCRLFQSGFPSLANDTLSFTITGANPSTSSRLASAVNALPNVGPCPPGSGIVSFAMNGLRCIGGNLVRHGVRATDANGATPNSWGPPAPNPPNGILAQGGFLAGQTRYFQSFYREDPALACGTGQNTSNAIEITVVP